MQLERYQDLFGARKPMIAMIHIHALPGTPAYGGSLSDVIDHAAKEASLLAKLGVDALMLENMHDTPYLNRQVGPEITASISAVAIGVRQAVPDLPCGLQVLAGANQAALAIAQAADLQFIRAEGFVFGHLGDEGWMNSDAGALLRYRRAISAEHIPIFTDIKKKHSAHAASADVSLAETAKAAQFFRSDGLIVTGSATGTAADTTDCQAVKAATPDLPLLIGSGIDSQNIHHYYHLADGFIVGSALKEQGFWANAIDPDRVKALVNRCKDLS